MNQGRVQVDSWSGRGLPEAFMEALKTGCLSPILSWVQVDETLFLAIRSGYINVYYRGCNLMLIRGQSPATAPQFSVHFDIDHLRKTLSSSDEYLARVSGRLREEIQALLAQPIDSRAAAMVWVEAIPKLKLAVDLGLGSGNDKHEREFQQLVARENNRSGISNETEYFIGDIEYSSTALGARFDIMGIRWLASDRRSGANCRLALVEMKYGDAALTGTSGLVKHLEQVQKLVESGFHQELNREIASLFAQLRDLGLVRFGAGGNDNPIEIHPTAIPEFVFLLANHNPRSPKLRQILAEMEDSGLLQWFEERSMPVKFFVAGFGGYAMHTANMLDLREFRALPMLGG